MRDSARQMDMKARPGLRARPASLNGARPAPRDQPQRMAGRKTSRTSLTPIQAKRLRVGHPRSDSRLLRKSTKALPQ
jgi:hypothetical protein